MASTCILSQNHLKKPADELKKTFNVHTLFRIIHIKSLILAPPIRTLYSNRPRGRSHPCGRGCRHRSTCKSSLVMFEKKVRVSKSEFQNPIVSESKQEQQQEKESEPELEPEPKPELEPLSEGYLAHLAVLLLLHIHLHLPPLNVVLHHLGELLSLVDTSQLGRKIQDWIKVNGGISQKQEQGLYARRNPSF